MLSTQQASKILGVTARRVRALIKSGRLPANKIGRDWLISESNLNKVTIRPPGRPKK